MFLQFSRWMERIAIIPRRYCISSAAGLAHPSAGRPSLAFRSSSASYSSRFCTSGVNNFSWTKPQGCFEIPFFFPSLDRRLETIACFFLALNVQKPHYSIVQIEILIQRNYTI
jgi:hypothetical protein